MDKVERIFRWVGVAVGIPFGIGICALAGALLIAFVTAAFGFLVEAWSWAGTEWTKILGL